jgi:hypothetical protein
MRIEEEEDELVVRSVVGGAGPDLGGGGADGEDSDELVDAGTSGLDSSDGGGEVANVLLVIELRTGRV